MPFEIPDSWCWVRLGYLISIISGVSYDKKDVAKNGIRILRGGNIQNLQVLTFDDDVFLPENYKDNEKQVKLNDILIVASTGSKTVIGKAGYINKEIDNTQIGAFLRIVRPLFSELVEYIKLIFATDYYREHIRTQAQGTNINNVKSEYITRLLVPIPPINEQQQIIEKIEKFEPLIEEYDKLEQAKSKLDNEIYDKLKKSILQYAIQGKLVPQDESDEPASVLLEKIRAEKKAQLGKKYVDSYIYKGDDNCYYEHINEKAQDEAIEVPFDLPDNWAWSRLKNIADFENGDRSQKYPVESDYVPVGIPFWGAKDIIENELTVTPNLRYISEKKFDELGNGKLRDKDFVCLLRGSVGKWASFDANEDMTTGFINAQMVIIRMLNLYVTYWMKIYFSSPLFTNSTEQTVSGTAVNQMSAKDLSLFLIPIPPLDEQKRIVDKINEIFVKL